MLRFDIIPHVENDQLRIADMRSTLRRLERAKCIRRTIVMVVRQQIHDPDDPCRQRPRYPPRFTTRIVEQPGGVQFRRECRGYSGLAIVRQPINIRIIDVALLTRRRCRATTQENSRRRRERISFLAPCLTRWWWDVQRRRGRCRAWIGRTSSQTKKCKDQGSGSISPGPAGYTTRGPIFTYFQIASAVT